MEAHCNRLSLLCRTCGNKIVSSGRSRNPKPVNDYAIIINKIFNVDVSKDDRFVHPTSICETCRKRLDHCLKSKVELYAEAPIKNFEAHSETNCFVCSVRTIKLPNLSVQKSEVQIEVPEIAVPINIISKELIISKCLQHKLSNMTSSIENDSFCVVKFEYVNNIPNIIFTIIIHKFGTWNVFTQSENVSSLIPAPSQLNETNIDDLFSFVSKNNICPGNNDFPDIVEKKVTLDPFLDKSGSVVASIQSKNFEKILKSATIRHVGCSIFVPVQSLRCEKCNEYRKVLNTISWRKKQVKADESIHKNTRNKYLSKEQLIDKTEKLTNTVKNLRKSVNRYEKFISDLIDNEGEVVSDDLHTICSETSSSDNTTFADDSPQSLLWEQQKKQADLKNSKSMKWHPLMIRWCLSIYLKSPGAYEHLRKSGFLCLPHKSTILKYANYTDPQCGINIDVLKKLFDITKNDQGVARYVGIIFDEMKIKSGLIYSRHDGKVVGFAEIGDINNELLEFKNRIENNLEHPPIATHMLTFMVRGVCSSLKFPFAYFAGQGFTSDQLYPCVWECIRSLEALNLKVVFITSDGASPNRRFYKLHTLADSENLSHDGVVYWCWNRHAPPEKKRKLYFICDVPHLIKTTRNNFENSHSHNKTRNLMVNGYQISWAHIISLLEFDMGENPLTPGLRQTKLTTEHVYLTPPLRMNVALAAQVLSNSTAVCLAAQNRSETIETRRFISILDTFFDCLNVKSFYEGVRRKKENLKPYVSEYDKRLKWLENDFLGYLNAWQMETESIPKLTKDEQRKLCLSQQTLEGIRITVHSFVEIVPLMLRQGASYILSDKLNQDPLEEHFGKQRMKGGSRENPTLQDYKYTELKLQVGVSPSLHVARGNTRGRKDDDITCESPLVKRPKK